MGRQIVATTRSSTYVPAVQAMSCIDLPTNGGSTCQHATHISQAKMTLLAAQMSVQATGTTPC